MKKFLCLLLAGLLFCACACAESAAPGALVAGEIRKLQLSDSLDVDGDGSADTVALAVSPTDDDDTADFTLTVNGMSAAGEGTNLTDELYVMKLASGRGEVLFLVPETGMSDDNACHLFLLEDDVLLPVGDIPSAACDITIQDNVFTGMVRGATLQTWFRPGDYIIARDYGLGDQYTPQSPIVAEVPRMSYPMGTVVNVKASLTLFASPLDAETVAMTLKAGDQAVIAASDDASWIYLAPLSNASYYDYAGGYVRIKGFQVMTDDGWAQSGDVFDGLLFAD